MSVENMESLIARQTERAGMPPAPQGADPAAAQAAQQSAAAQATQVAAAAKDKVDAAAKAAAPSGDDGEPAVYRFKRKVGDQEMEVALSEGQIMGTMERYSKLNAKHAAMKPALAVVEQLMEQHGDAGKVAEILAQAMGHNPQMGGKAAAEPAAPQAAAQAAVQGGEDIDLDGWGDAQGLDVSPIKGLVGRFDQRVGQIEGVIMQLANAVKALSERGHVEQGQQLEQQAGQVQQAHQALGVRQIQANMGAVQQKYQLPDEMEQPFIQFAAMRGYTLADFSDAELADMVAQDFVNQMRSPERDRLLAQLQRRQAFTGSLGSAPAAESAAAPAAPAPGAFIDRMVDARMTR